MYDLIIKGGEVIDPAQGIHDVLDVAVLGGRIEKVGKDLDASQAREVMDAGGQIVSPGLIDLHTHVFDKVTALGVNPDAVGVNCGVTTVVDAGSAGYANFGGFSAFVASQALTTTFCFLNVASTGLCLLPEVSDWSDLDIEGTIRVAKESGNLVKGIKLRLVGPLMTESGLEIFQRALTVAEATRLPLMIHIGDLGADYGERRALTRQVLGLLRKGDILTHPFGAKPGRVIEANGEVLGEFKSAVQRGILVDVGHGNGGFSFEIARMGLARGVLPFTISSDVSALVIESRVYNLPVTMSKFLNLGLALEQVIEMTTANPALALGMSDSLGSLKPGMPADITVAGLVQADWEFQDSAGVPLQGNVMFAPVATVKGGRAIPADLLRLPVNGRTPPPLSPRGRGDKGGNTR
ncbi:MAG: amidohydrolase/deacetylase family metallohydrolase [Chloroflexi bacterium]|nr:amidohydrolase/deacetylase family metallohydrolase [Chloroflexota bacterium]